MGDVTPVPRPCTSSDHAVDPAEYEAFVAEVWRPYCEGCVTVFRRILIKVRDAS